VTEPSSQGAAVQHHPWIISVDDHVVEPPHVWETWLPAKFKDRGPKIERRGVGAMKHIGGGAYEQEFDPDGKQADCWVFEDLVYIHKRHVAAVGYSRDEMTMTPMTYDEMRPGCYDPKARVEDMLMNHVDVSLCFPSFPRFCGQAFTEATDRELGEACVYAYNDWMVDEWCGESDGRLVPLCIVPLWDAELAAAEVRRNAARGVHAVAFSECPAWLGLPSIHSGHWDPFFRACEETQTALCMHIGSGTKTFGTSSDAPDAVTATGIFTNSAMSMIDWLFSGKLIEFPGLKLLYAECQIGWIPYVLERVDDIWRTHLWSRDEKKVPFPPSAQYYSNMYSCFFKDHVGVRMLDIVGEDNICFEVDYPHQDGTWPNTMSVAQDIFGHLTQTQIDKIARGNAARLLGLDA